MPVETIVQRPCPKPHVPGSPRRSDLKLPYLAFDLLQGPVDTSFPPARLVRPLIDCKKIFQDSGGSNVRIVDVFFSPKGCHYALPGS